MQSRTKRPKDTSYPHAQLAADVGWWGARVRRMTHLDNELSN